MKNKKYYNHLNLNLNKRKKINSFEKYQELRKEPIKFLCSLIDDFNKRLIILEDLVIKTAKKKLNSKASSMFQTDNDLDDFDTNDFN